jgi:hypothetical protein
VSDEAKQRHRSGRSDAENRFCAFASHTESESPFAGDIQFNISQSRSVNECICKLGNKIESVWHHADRQD